MPSDPGPKFLALILIAFCSYALTAQAQSKPPAVSPIDNATPLHLSLAPSAEPDVTGCPPGNVPNPIVVDVQYTGEHELRAWSIALYYPGTRGPATTEYDTASSIAYPPQQYIAKGADWAVTFCGVPAGIDPRTMHPQVDMLSFDDGTTTGPLELQSSFYLLGMADGFSFARGERSTPPSETPQRIEPGAAAAQNDESVVVGDVRFTPVFNPKRNTVVIEATNLGAKPVRAYFYKLEFYDSASGDLLHQTKTQLLDPRDSDDAVLAPRETWAAGPRRVPLESNGQRSVIKLTQAFIVYDDGTNAGDVSAATSQELLGILLGVTTGPKMLAAAHTE